MFHLEGWESGTQMQSTPLGERGEFTYSINHGVAIGETASWATIKINAVREIVGLGKGRKVVVVAIVNEGVSEYEHGRHHLSPPSTLA